jgi:hypothetical protein
MVTSWLGDAPTFLFFFEPGFFEVTFFELEAVFLVPFYLLAMTSTSV